MQRALSWWCWGVIGFGLVLAGGAFAATDAPAVMLLKLFGGDAVAATRALRFAVGLMGAVSIGWGASLLAVTRTTGDLAPDLRVTLWQRIGWAVALWFVVDRSISIATGFWPNAVSNSILAALFFAIQRRL